MARRRSAAICIWHTKKGIKFLRLTIRQLSNPLQGTLSRENSDFVTRVDRFMVSFHLCRRMLCNGNVVTQHSAPDKRFNFYEVIASAQSEFNSATLALPNQMAVKPKANAHSYSVIARSCHKCIGWNSNDSICLPSDHSVAICNQPELINNHKTTDIHSFHCCSLLFWPENGVTKQFRHCLVAEEHGAIVCGVGSSCRYPQVCCISPQIWLDPRKFEGSLNPCKLQYWYANKVSDNLCFRYVIASAQIVHTTEMSTFVV